MGSAAAKFVKTLRALGVVLVIGLITLAGRAMAVNSTTAGLAYVLVILLIATYGSLFESILASLVAVLCLNYFFLTPLFQFSIASPQDWVAVFVFVITAVVVSELSSTAKRQTRAALSRGREMEQLYALSRAALLHTAPNATAREVSLQIARVFGFTGVSLFERSTEQISRAGVEDMPEWDERLREAALSGNVVEDKSLLTVATSIRLGAEVTGGLVLRGARLSDSALQSLSNLVAIALERARMVESTNAAELIRKSEELKSTLLDAIAHEFKTPLTSIKAAASALRSGVTDASSRQEYIEIVDEEADRLERLVTNAVQMARIEAGELKLDCHAVVVAEMASAAVASLDGLLDRGQVAHKIPGGLTAYADHMLIELALKQVLDNARKYATLGSLIEIEAHQEDGQVLITISNEGAGIPESEQRRIFDRYYRAPDTRNQVPGTGIGLSIAREIVLAHEGRIWVESAPGKGARLRFSIPASHE